MHTWTVAQSKKYCDDRLSNNEAPFSLLLNLPLLLSLYSSAQHLSYSNYWPFPSSISSHRKESFGEAGEAGEGSKGGFWLFFTENACNPFNFLSDYEGSKALFGQIYKKI